jgi:acyl-CoA thioester hydrolase
MSTTMPSNGESDGPPEADFNFSHSVPVRFQDIDAYGHAHHSKPLIYFEEARWAYWNQVVGTGEIPEVRYVLAEFNVRYHKRILYPDILRVGVRVTGVGRKHFVMIYEARSGTGELLSSGTSTQVMYDYASGGSAAVPDELRATLEAFDGPF